MNKTNVYNKIQILFAKLDETTSTKAEIAQKHQVATTNLKEELAKSEANLSEMKEKRETKIDKTKEKERIALLQEEMQNLNETYQEIREKVDYVFFLFKKTIMEELKSSNQPIGQCEMLINVKKDLLKCPKCGVNYTTFSSQNKEFPENHINCLFCAKTKDKSQSNQFINDFTDQDKIIRELQLLQEIKAELEKEDTSATDIDFLETKLKDQEQLIKELKDKLEANQIHQDKLSINKENFSQASNFSLEILSNDFSKKYKKMHFRTSTNRIAELTIEDKKIIYVKKRQRKKEKSHFLCWIEDLQLCAIPNQNSKKWSIQLYDDKSQLDSKAVVCYDEGDSFFLYSRYIYLSVYGSNELYGIRVENRKLVVEKLCETDGKVSYVLERIDKLIVGTHSGNIQLIEDGTATTLYYLPSFIVGFSLEGNWLSAADSKGYVVQLDLDTGTEMNFAKLDVDRCYICIACNLIGSKNDQMLLFNWKGKTCKQFEHKIKECKECYYTVKSTMVTDKEGNIYVFDHDKYSFVDYSEIDIAPFYQQR